jgi:hypothetical protein
MKSQLRDIHLVTLKQAKYFNSAKHKTAKTAPDDATLLDGVVVAGSEHIHVTAPNIQHYGFS